MTNNQKSFKIMMLVAVNLALLILIADFCTLRSYAINLGENGERIAALQRCLKEKGYYNGTINGIYDFTTRKAVRNFGKENGIDCDEATDYEIISLLGIGAKSYNGCFSSDIELLAKYLKSHGVIGYHDMVNTCEKLIEISDNGLLYAYIIGETDDINKLIEAKPDSEHYAAAFQTVRRSKNYYP